MRRNHLRMIVGLAVVLLMGFSSATAETMFSIRNGITWNTTIEQLMVIEGIKEGDPDVYLLNDGRTTNLAFTDESTGYVFGYQNGELVIVACYFLTETMNTFSAQLAFMQTMYGEATEFDKGMANELYNAILPDEVYITEEDIDSIAGWLFSDGTYVYVLDLHGDSVLIYFNTNALLGIG